MKSYSQFNEDIFLKEFFEKKNIKNGFFFEFGAWDGIYLSNCRLLFESGWSGCLVELDKKRYKKLKTNYENYSNIILVKKKISYENKNINEIIKKNNIKNIDLLSIDVDGNDLSIWKGLEILNPKVVVIEFNLSIPFDVDFEDKTAKNIGSSFLAIYNFAKDKNYDLIHVTSCNLIFCDKKLNSSEFKILNEKDVYEITKPTRIGFNNYGEFLFFENNKLNFKELFRAPFQKSFITFQPIPKFLRKLTDVNGNGVKILKRIYSITVLLILRPNLFFKYLFSKFK